MATKRTAGQLANIVALATHATEIRALGKRAFDDIVEIGRRLIEAKKLCGHGNWLSWLKREFGWKEQSTRNFMNVAEMAAKSPTVGDLNIDCRGLYLLAAPSTPAEVIETVVKRGERVTTAQIKELVKERKPAKPKLATKPSIDRGDPNRVWRKLSEAARDLGQRMIAVGPTYRSIIEHWSGDDRVAFTRLMRDPQKALEADRSLEALLEHVEAELAKGTQAATAPERRTVAPQPITVSYMRIEDAEPEPIRTVSVTSSPSTRPTTTVTLDHDAAEAMRLILSMEAFARSAEEAKMAKLASIATAIGRDRAALKRIAETIIDAFAIRH